MFLEKFGLARDPFLDTADPSFYYETIACAHGRRRLFECMAGGRGLAMVVGPVGAGKTTLCNAALQNLLGDERNWVGLILDPTFDSEAEFLTAIGDCLGLDVAAERPARALKEQLKRRLFEAAAPGRQPVLLIDEAQLLKEELLETLRALLNYQLDERKLLALALFGQMELAAAVQRRPNLRDRVALWLELRPVSESEAAALLDHRLRCAGYHGASSPLGAVAGELWRHSAGLPRRLTALAREGMEVAGERGRAAVTTADVEVALQRLGPPLLDDRTGQATSSPAPARPWWQLWRSAS